MGWEYLYLAAALAFIFGIKRLGKVRTARSGNRLAALGMLGSIVAVCLLTPHLEWWVVVAGLVVGSAIGAIAAARVQFTEMPELVAAFNGTGGAASSFVAFAFLAGKVASVGSGKSFPELDGVGLASAVTVPITILIGTATLTGSIAAYLKLGGKKLSHPVQGSARHYFNALLGILLIASAVGMVTIADDVTLIALAGVVTLVSAVLGLSLVLPIGGADMPVVVALLNSYSGIAASASGFILGNQMLVVCGALVGASGLILTQIMCKAMNRSLGNVLLGGIGDDTVAEDARDYTNVTEAGAEEVAMILESATSVIMVPGYGLAVAQAQHALRELGDLLEARDVQVRYAIHPVAGRMPGHMNVLLAEADVSYDKLFELERINSDFSSTDVVIVVGANDVVNPVARTDNTSPIYGMPILDVDKAQTVVMIKRSLSPGYAGIKNPLFEADNTMMVFADAKAALEGMITEVKDL